MMTVPRKPQELQPSGQDGRPLLEPFRWIREVGQRRKQIARVSVVSKRSNIRSASGCHIFVISFGSHADVDATGVVFWICYGSLQTVTDYCDSQVIKSLPFELRVQFDVHRLDGLFVEVHS